jgi:hypothetical protein
LLLFSDEPRAELNICKLFWVFIDCHADSRVFLMFSISMDILMTMKWISRSEVQISHED